jgi:hypothetical protein
MSEILHIKKFGPIEDVKLEFKKVNILIGDQGTGKSTIVKLISAIKSNFFKDIFDVPDDAEDRPTKVFLKHLENFGIEKLVKIDSEISFVSNDFAFKFSNKKVILIKVPEYLFALSLGFNINYIPAERIMIPSLTDALFGLMQEKVLLPKLFLRFGIKFQSSRREQPDFFYREILQVDYSHINGLDYVVLKDGNKIFLTDASSGMQGAIPLLVVLDSVYSQNYLSRDFDNKVYLNKNLFMLILEEPELNLFPETQRKLLGYIIAGNFIEEKSGTSIKNNIDNRLYKNNLYITTHSPYILTSLNNLMYAYEVGQKHSEEVNKIIEKKYWLNPEDVSAYMLLPNGTCENILDKDEEGSVLIDAGKIDEISRQLNSDFDKLIDLEMVNTNE